MHNYRANQSALVTRCGTDFRHQYGIFGSESQTSFTRNATRAGSEEGRLFSQANDDDAMFDCKSGFRHLHGHCHISLTSFILLSFCL